MLLPSSYASSRAEQSKARLLEIKKVSDTIKWTFAGAKCIVEKGREKKTERERERVNSEK